jgi:hypothetical protein
VDGDVIRPARKFKWLCWQPGLKPRIDAKGLFGLVATLGPDASAQSREIKAPAGERLRGLKKGHTRTSKVRLSVTTCEGSLAICPRNLGRHIPSHPSRQTRCQQATGTHVVTTHEGNSTPSD